MAIQKINLGTEPLGEGGDTNRSANTKINENFSNTDHAASRLVGTANGNIPVFTNRGIADTGLASKVSVSLSSQDTILSDVVEMGSGIRRLSIGRTPFGASNSPMLVIKGGDVLATFSVAHTSGIVTVTAGTAGRYVEGNINTNTLYGTANTTKEEGTGYLVASSPVLKVQHDSFEKVHEAEQLEIDVKSNKTGVYEITGTTGLREGDGWSLKPPKDVNGNVLCICEATEKDGVITLKTYKKKFDFETVSIVADYEQPTDIPEGATVMLRFNDLPQETIDEDYLA